MYYKPPFQSLLLLVSALTQTTSAAYSLLQDYSGNAFFEGFDFFTGPDPTAGHVQFHDITSANQTGLAGFINTGNGSEAVFMGVDSTQVAPNGRGAVRVSSRQSFQHALVIVDIAHMPGGICGTWPAFWMVGPSWPDDGEIDIVEGVNDQTTNVMTLHTAAGLSLSTTGSSKNLAPFAGKIATSNCDVNAPDQAKNAGCSIVDTSNLTFGAGFNAAGGGVYATEWTSQFIKIWFFPRGNIPSDIASGNPQPQASWGEPRSVFQDGLSLDDHFNNLQIVFDNTFCGDWAGQVWNETEGCRALAPTCEDYVTNNPQAFTEAYWAVNALQVFQDTEALDGTVSVVEPSRPSHTKVTSPVNLIILLGNSRRDSNSDNAGLTADYQNSRQDSIALLILSPRRVLWRNGSWALSPFRNPSQAMAGSPDGVAVANDTFPAFSRVRIANLEPGRGASDQYIEASVSLVWPYSSSTRQFSLLLAELDGITRRQVKVTFHKDAAKAAQASRVGIGDILRLSLDGCSWTKIQDELSTPGKRLGSDIDFTSSFKIEVNPGHESARRVNYQYRASPSTDTPSIHSVIDLTGSTTSGPAEIWIQFSSPPSRKSLRMSSCSFVEASLDPFAEDKEYVYARSRKRTKFARESGSWRLLDSGDDDVAVEDKQAAVESAATNALPSHPLHLDEVEAAPQPSHTPPESVRPTSSTSRTSPTEVDQDQPEEPPSAAATPFRNPPEDLMPPPQRPSRELLESRHIALPENAAEGVVTPRLHPLPSPGLPLVSPLVTGFGADDGFFPRVATTSELDATATSVHSRTNSVASISSGDPSPVDKIPVPEEDTQTVAELEPVQTAILDAADHQENHLTFSQPRESPPLEPQSTPPARNMLDFLEEFLLMSPTSPEAVQDAQLSPSALSTAETSGRSDEASSDSASASHVVVLGGAHSDNDPALLAERSSRPESVEPSTMDNLTGIEKSVNLVTQPVSPPSEDSGILTTEQPPSLVVCSEMKSPITAVNEHPLGTKDDTLTNDQITLNQISNEDVNYLPTPAQTQEQEVSVIEERLAEASLPISHSQLLTPDHTQTHSHTPAYNVDGLVDEQEESPDAIESLPSFNHRRLDEESSSLSEASKHLSSPYFTSRRQPTPKSPTSSSFKKPKADHGQSVGLTTPISYYTPLAFLREHYNHLVDIIAICVSDSAPFGRTARGPKDWHTTLRVADPSFDVKVGSGSGSVVLLFRYAKDAVPSTKRGDAVILRDFKVETRNHEAVLLSTNSSSWAVFDGSLDEGTMVEEPVLSGPPLEYGKGEAGHVRKMVRWWVDEGNGLFPDKWNNTSELINVEDANHAERNVDSSPQSRAQVWRISMETTPTPGEEDTVESIEKAPVSRVETQKRAQMIEDGNDEGRTQLDEGSKGVEKGKQVLRTPGKASAPQSLQWSRGTKTPSANTGSKLLSSSPEQPSSQRSQGKLQTGRRRRTRSPSLVHELRDGKGYVDGRTKEDLHELRNGTKYVDGE
ncbi:hypothetical protein DV738_g3139, partial [Chaetothyriales sp. CBS 135597]